MLLTALIVGAALTAAAPAAPADGTYKGTMTDGQPVRIVVEHGRVSTAFATVASYRCGTFGEVGPLAVAVLADAPVRARRFAFDAGRTPSYLRMHGTFTAAPKGKARRAAARVPAVTGTLRAYGTIATGQTCTSPTRGFTLKRVAKRG